MQHQAAPQMLGYLYQVRYALKMLLARMDETSQICLEKFDDVSFHKNYNPIELIQLKHHVGNLGDLTDSSSDLWRTLKVWIDIILAHPEFTFTTKFLIVTTASAPIDSAANFLKADENRDIDLAYKKLVAASETSRNRNHEAYYIAFQTFGEQNVKQLLLNSYVIEKACGIIDVETEIRKEIRYASSPQYESMIFERLEGWWIKKTIEALCSDSPIFISQSQMRSFIVGIAQEYAPDNLPIDSYILDDISEDMIPSCDRVFYEQIKLIGLGNHRVCVCLRDYYRAFQQRANWIRNDLLYLNELDKYEARLIDEWEHAFYSMQDDLQEYGDQIDDSIKAARGRALFSSIEDKDIPIRPRCSDAFIMRGTYHKLSNKLKVGWHLDFVERLKYLLEPR